MARIPDMIVPRVDAQPMQVTPMRGEAQAWQAPDVTTPIIRRTGEAMSSAGAAMMRIGEVIQNRRDDTVVMKSDALLGEDQLNIIYGYKNQIGEAADAGYEPTLKQFDERRRKIETGLENDTQRTLFGARADRRRLDLMHDALSHRAAQSKVAKAGAAEASAKQFANDYVYAVEQGVEQPGPWADGYVYGGADPVSRAMAAKAQAINAIRRQWTEIRNAEPQGPDYQAYEKASLGALHGMAIDRLMALQKYDEAIGYVDAIPAGEIDEDPRTKMLAQVSGARDRRDGVAAAKTLSEGYQRAMVSGTDDERNQAAAFIGIGQQVDPAAPPEVRFQQRQAQREAAAAWMARSIADRTDMTPGAKKVALDAVEGSVKQAEEAIAAYGNQLVEAAKASILNSPPELTARAILTESDKQMLRNVNRLEEVLAWAESSKRTVGDPQKGAEAAALTNEDLMRYAGPAELAKDYASYLPPNEYAKLLVRWRNASGEALSDVDKYFLREDEELKAAAKRIWSEPDKDQIYQFAKAAQERLEIEAAVLGKGKPDSARREAIYAAVARDMVFYDDYVFDHGTRMADLKEGDRGSAYVKVQRGKDTTLVYTSSSEDVAGQRDILPAVRKDIRTLLTKKLGRSPSEQEIAEWYIDNPPKNQNDK